LQTARHVEFQVLGDQHGKLLHLFERECSLQRRRQKIVEETPSPLMDAKLRTVMSAAALAAASAVGYTNAGTVEFLVDSATRHFYFLEMNTRIQVEHPITELVCGIDIVQWQLRIAAGEKLALEQKDIHQRGHAIECRLYAEDPAVGFLPQTGRVLKMLQPEGDGVRVDAGIVVGTDVGVYYDPLLAKLIVHADTRSAALERMQAALHDTAFLGLTTNIEFLQDLLAHRAVQAGDYDTRFVENQLVGWSVGQIPDEVLFAAALLDMQPVTTSVADDEESPDPYSPWARADGFRIGGGR
jgi:acetyl/propionyl-CoA carboxylase alpha subunit